MCPVDDEYWRSYDRNREEWRKHDTRLDDLRADALRDARDLRARHERDFFEAMRTGNDARTRYLLGVAPASYIPPDSPVSAGYYRRVPTPTAEPRPETELIGWVTHYWGDPSVAEVYVMTNELLLAADELIIRGDTSRVRMTVTSLRIDDQPVTEVSGSQSATMWVPEQVRKGNGVYKIIG